jgi:succinate-acetate transporter protein
MSIETVRTVGERLILGVCVIVFGAFWLYYIWPTAFHDIGSFFNLSRGLRDKSGLFAVIISLALILFGVYELISYAKKKNS